MGLDVPPGARDPTLDNEVEARGGAMTGVSRSKVSRRSESLGLSSCSRISLDRVSLLLLIGTILTKLFC